MKKSYFKIIWREFKGSFGRFAAIFGIVALGVGFLSGLLVTTPDMHISVNEYYDKYNMADIFIKATMGLTEEDLEEVKEIKNVKDIMPAYVIDTLMDIDNKSTIVAKVYGVPLLGSEEEKNINKLQLIEGRMPQNTRECVVERKGPFLNDIKIGSKLKISRENKDYDDIDEIFDEKEYKVVGIVGNSFHFSLEREISNVGSGKLGTIIYVDKESYALDTFTDFYIIAENAFKMDGFSLEYEDYIEEIRKNIEEIGHKRSLARKREILDKANEKLSEGYEEYNEGKDKADRELEKGLKEINKGKKELQRALIEIKDGEKELKDAREILKRENEKAKKDIKNGEKELENARLSLVQGEKGLATAKIELEEGQKKYDEGYRQYEIGKRELDKGIIEISKAEEVLLEGERGIVKGREELKRGLIELRRGKEELEKGEVQYQEGIFKLTTGKREFLEGISPIAIEVRFPSAETLISTPQGRSALKTYLMGANQQLINGLAEAKAGKIEIENNISLLSQKVLELGAGLENLNRHLQYLEQDPDANAGKILEIKASINELLGNQAEVNGNLKVLKSKLIDVNNQIGYLEEKQKDLPSYDFLINNWNEIEKNENQLDKAKETLTTGWKEYNSGLQELGYAEIELNNAEREIEKGKIEIQNNRRQLEIGVEKSEKGLKELQIAKEELTKGKKEYQSGILDIEKGWQDYKNGISGIKEGKKILQSETENGLKEIEDGEKALKDGLKEYKKGIKKLEKAEREYNTAKIEIEEELNDAYNEIKDAEAEIRDLDDPEWYVLDRESNISYVSFVLNADKVDAVAKVFPIFFYLVAGLVALTTMTRMVEEERTQIGVLKALGYKKTTIIFKYILYCGLASVLGSMTGLFVGFKLIPRVIWNAYGTMYHLPKFVTDYNNKIALLSSGMAILSTVAATFFSASGALKEKPALLMLPRPPKKGKRIILERITPLWSLMSFNLKSTARNIFRYKKHFYMTVIGISGCTALLIAGFGLRDSIKDIGDLQFDQLFKYELEIQLKEDFSLDKIKQITGKQEEIIEVLEVFSDKGYVQFEDERVETILVGVENIEDIAEYVLFKDRKKGKIIEPTKDKIIISEKAAEVLKVKEGDIVIYENSDEIKREFKIDGITENYVNNYLYMDKSIYERTFKEKQKTNTIYAKTNNLESMEEDKLIKDLYENEGVLNAEFISQMRGIFDNLIESINYIVVVIIVASGLLAFIVLYNLTNININERRRELATLKVLGFHDKEVSTYIFREITILTVIGTFVGLILGKYLHQFIILTVEDSAFMFGRDVSIISYIISAVITLFFSAVVDIFMAKKLKNIKMVDSLKAND